MDRGLSETEDRDHGWFAARNRGTPPEAFDDVTAVSGVELDVEIVEEPAQRTATPPPAVSHDRRFAELGTIVEQLRAVLRETQYMTETEIDSVEWLLRQRMAQL